MVLHVKSEPFNTSALKQSEEHKKASTNKESIFNVAGIPLSLYDCLCIFLRVLCGLCVEVIIPLKWLLREEAA